MIGYLIVGGAAAVDGFAAGVYIGRKWGSKLTNAAVQADGAAVEQAISSAVAKAKADAAAVEAKVAPVATDVKADAAVVSQDAAAVEAKIKAALDAAKATA